MPEASNDEYMDKKMCSGSRGKSAFVLLGLRWEAQQQDPRHPAPRLWTARWELARNSRQRPAVGAAAIVTVRLRDKSSDRASARSAHRGKAKWGQEAKTRSWSCSTLRQSPPPSSTWSPPAWPSCRIGPRR